MFCNVFCNLSSKRQGKPMVFQHVQQNNARNNCFCIVFCNMSGNSFFQHFQQNLATKTKVLYCFLQPECKKPRTTIVFSIFSAKYYKQYRFCNVFCNLSAKNQGEPTFFQQYFQQNIAKSIGSVMFFAIQVQKTEESQGFFNIFSKILQKTQVL